MNEKYCSNCGELLVPGSRFCTGCGRPVNQNAAPAYGQNGGRQNSGGYNSHNGYNGNQNTYNTPAVQQNQYYQPYQAPVMQKMSKKEYRKVCTNEKYLKELKSNAIVLYVLVVINALIALAANPWMLLDAGINLVLTLGMHLGKRKGCAVGILVIAIASALISVAENGRMTGYLWIIAGIAALKAFSIADKEYESIYGK
ncbi:MAG: zinc ribbon domain-containing protein [Oscillospiraceae bacterium]|nr:zinc ribbon domain-containing protein [Oscillospiraceae bacterium]